MQAVGKGRPVSGAISLTIGDDATHVARQPATLHPVLRHRPVSCRERRSFERRQRLLRGQKRRRLQRRSQETERSRKQKDQMKNLIEEATQMLKSLSRQPEQGSSQKPSLDSLQRQLDELRSHGKGGEATRVRVGILGRRGSPSTWQGGYLV